jgi:hypothetical protein cresD4_02576
MARLALKDIEARIAPLGDQATYDREFLFSLLAAYGKPKSSITRLRNGSLNVAADPTREVAQKDVVYFREVPTATDTSLLEAGEQLRTAAHVLRYTPRFIMVTDYTTLFSWDTKTGENIVFPLREIAQHFTFFLPWAGMEKAQYVAERHADVKAAEQMGKLFDELLKANPIITKDETQRHGLNVFFTRLLFCLFAEDTGIFADNQFTNAVGSHTQEDGSDIHIFLNDLFKALDTESPEDKPAYLADFPYVNGRLFSSDHTLIVPTFTKAARAMLLGLGKLIWQEINPDIFGSMFQAIVTPGKRSDLGQHYTSVPNILKTIEPLFLDDLRKEFDTAWDSAKKLGHLLDRISKIRIFDPACGSGNFLVIAYKELRRLEHAILERLADLDASHNTLFTDSVISIEHFYGIEIDDFAVEVAILSLWIAKHQMNREFEDKFGTAIPLIPLREAGTIYAGNAIRIDWNTICPNEGMTEIYLIGNPPYGGAKKLKAAQKEDYDYAFDDRPYSKNLDYIALWFIKGAAYISRTQAQLAFVSTNSVTQGEHVGLMFPMIFEMGLEIGYAYRSFKWENNAKHNAGVTVVVISLRNVTNKIKYLYSEHVRTQVTNINGYLIDADDISISRRKQPLTEYLPTMNYGSMPRDGGNLILSETDLADLRNTDPQAERFVKSYCGAKDFIEGNQRYCLWITDSQAQEAQESPWISSRLRAVSEYRQISDASSTAKYANRPHLFVQRAYRPTDSIIVPRVSSERRDYVPIGYLGPETVISDAANAIYDAEPWLFALLTSRMHMVWLRAVGGKMKTDYRYSNTLVYNNFPVPPLTDQVKEALTQRAFRVLDVREYHCEHTLAELYDADKMPENLRQAHADLDIVLDRIYRRRPFDSDEERLRLLFDLYRQMTNQEASAQQAPKPTRHSRRTRKVQ